MEKNIKEMVKDLEKLNDECQMDESEITSNPNGENGLNSVEIIKEILTRTTEEFLKLYDMI